MIALTKPEILLSCAQSIISFYVIYFVLSTDTPTRYINETVGVALEFKSRLFFALPFITATYVFFLYKTDKKVTRLHTNLHWVITIIAVCTDYSIRKLST